MMDTENLMREILSKMCSSHGKRPNITFDRNWKLNVSASFDEFKEMMAKKKGNFENKPDWVFDVRREKL